MNTLHSVLDHMRLGRWREAHNLVQSDESPVLMFKFFLPVHQALNSGDFSKLYAHQLISLSSKIRSAIKKRLG